MFVGMPGAEISISKDMGDALVPLAAATLGAVIGGLLTGKVTRDLDEARRRQQDERKRTEERVAVRWLMEAYKDEVTRASALAEYVMEEKLWPYMMTITPLGFQDRMLLIRYLNDGERITLFAAEGSIDALISAGEMIGGSEVHEPSDLVRKAHDHCEKLATVLQERIREFEDEDLPDDPAERVRERLRRAQ
jgi:hypothetical protein